MDFAGSYLSEKRTKGIKGKTRRWESLFHRVKPPVETVRMFIMEHTRPPILLLDQSLARQSLRRAILHPRSRVVLIRPTRWAWASVDLKTRHRLLPFQPVLWIRQIISVRKWLESLYLARHRHRLPNHAQSRRTAGTSLRPR